MPVPTEARSGTDTTFPRRRKRKERVLREKTIPHVPIPIFFESERIKFPQISPLSMLRLERVINIDSKEPVYPDEFDQELFMAYDNLSANPPDPKTVDNECFDALGNFLPILELQATGKLPRPIQGNDAQVVADWLAREHTERVIQAGVRFLNDYPTTRPNYNEVKEGYKLLYDMLNSTNDV